MPVAAQEKKTKKPGYKPASLPPLLDLSNKNTKLQLLGEKEDPKRQSEDACKEVMHDHLKSWIENDADKLVDARSRECDMQAFWLWLRDFHKEYNDEWYIINMPRLKDQFMPTFKAVLKDLRPTVVPEPSADLLDMGSPIVVPSCGSNLLDVCSDANLDKKSATPSFPSSSVSPNVETPAAPSNGVHPLSRSTVGDAPFTTSIHDLFAPVPMRSTVGDAPRFATMNIEAVNALFPSQPSGAPGNPNPNVADAVTTATLARAPGSVTDAVTTAKTLARAPSSATPDLLDFAPISSGVPAASNLLDL